MGAPSSTEAVYSRTAGVVQNVDNAGYTEITVTVPTEGRLRRVRAEFAAGSVGTQIALQVREATGVSTGLPVVLAYALTPTGIDSLEDIYYQSTSPSISSGSLFVAVTTNGALGSADTINISLDIEGTA